MAGPESDVVGGGNSRYAGSLSCGDCTLVVVLGYTVYAVILEVRPAMSKDEDRQMRDKLTQLRLEHRDLDDAIAALESSGIPDQLQLRRFKKRKLALKDEMKLLEARLLPDIIA